MKLEEGRRLAEELLGILKPSCERIEIAGGIRRGKEEPHDIELVAIPKMEQELDPFGFNWTGHNHDELFATVHRLIDSGALQKGKETVQRWGETERVLKPPLGPKYYRLRYQGEKVDIFSVTPPAQWGLVFLLRTGDSEFSQAFVTRLWKFGMKSREGRIEVDRATWMKTPEEEDAFRVCGLPFIEPRMRSIAWFAIAAAQADECEAKKQEVAA